MATEQKGSSHLIRVGLRNRNELARDAKEVARSDSIERLIEDVGLFECGNVRQEVTR